MLILLGERGIHGHAHMMMLEKSDLEIAAPLDDWMVKNVRE